MLLLGTEQRGAYSHRGIWTGSYWFQQAGDHLTTCTTRVFPHHCQPFRKNYVNLKQKLYLKLGAVQISWLHPNFKVDMSMNTVDKFKMKLLIFQDASYFFSGPPLKMDLTINAKEDNILKNKQLLHLKLINCVHGNVHLTRKVQPKQLHLSQSLPPYK